MGLVGRGGREVIQERFVGGMIEVGFCVCVFFWGEGEEEGGLRLYEGGGSECELDPGV